MATRETTLTEYMNQIESKYQDARRDYLKASSKLAEYKREYDEKIKSNTLNPQGVAIEKAKFDGRKNEQLKIMRACAMDFQYQAKTIRNTVDSLFAKLYELNPGAVDEKCIKLLERGIASEKELQKIATNYYNNGNMTMFRYAVSFLPSDTKDVNTRTLRAKSHECMNRVDLNTVDSLITVCEKSLRDDSVLADNRFCNLVILKAATFVFGRCQNPNAQIYANLYEARLATYLEHDLKTLESCRGFNRGGGHFRTDQGLLGDGGFY